MHEGQLEALRSLAMDYAVDGMVITDPNQDDDPIIDCNQAFCDLTGYTRDEIIGRNCRFLQNGERNQADLNQLVRDMRREQPTRVVVKNYRKNGDRFWNELSVSPVKNDRGEVTHFIGIQHDVTATVEAQAKLEIELETARMTNVIHNIDVIERRLASAYLSRAQ